MAWSVQYESVPVRQEVARRSRSRKRVYFAGAAVCAWLALMFVPAARNWLQQLFFPGSREVTTQALEALAWDLRQGQPVGEAIYAFCQEIFASIG